MGARMIDGRGLVAEIEEEIVAEVVRCSPSPASADDVVGTGTISVDGSGRRERIDR